MAYREICKDMNLCPKAQPSPSPIEATFQTLIEKIDVMMDPRSFDVNNIGTNLWSIIVLDYIYYSHDNVCQLIPRDVFEERSATIPIGITIDCVFDETKGIIDIGDECDIRGVIADTFFEELYRCAKSGKRFAILPINLIFTSVVKCSHQNVIIFDFEKNTVERYDPNGIDDDPQKRYTRVCNPSDVVDVIWKTTITDFNKKYDTKLSYQGESSFCIGMQQKQAKDVRLHSRAYCSLWAAWFIDMRLSHPQISQKEILEKTQRLISSKDITYTNFIVSYAKFLVDQSRYRDLFYS